MKFSFPAPTSPLAILLLALVLHDSLVLSSSPQFLSQSQSQSSSSSPGAIFSAVYKSRADFFHSNSNYAKLPCASQRRMYRRKEPSESRSSSGGADQGRGVIASTELRRRRCEGSGVARPSWRPRHTPPTRHHPRCACGRRAGQRSRAGGA